MAEKSITYISKPGKTGTAPCVAAAAARAKELGIKKIVVSTTSGKSALAMAEALKKVGHTAEVIAVGYSAEYAAKWGAFDAKIQAQAEKMNVRFIKGTHVFGGIDGAVAAAMGGVAPGKLIAATYYTLGQGFKVAVEVALMAADQGCVDTAKPVIALGGTGEGVDTALTLTPATASQFFKLKIHEVVCMVK
jgi:hypothetical protein